MKLIILALVAVSANAALAPSPVLTKVSKGNFFGATELPGCPAAVCPVKDETSACITYPSNDMKANGCKKFPCGATTCPAMTCPKDCKLWYNGVDTCTCTDGVASGCTPVTSVMYGRPRCLDTAPCKHGDGSKFCKDPTFWDASVCKCVSNCTDTSDVPTECDDKEADIAFVLDSSGSITSSGWSQLIQAVGNIVTGLEIASDKIQVAAHIFSSNTNSFPGFHLNEHYGWQNVKAEINTFPFIGHGTKLGAAVKNTNDNVLVPSAGRRPTVPAAMIIVTDGMTTDAALATSEAQAAKDAGVKIFTIGVNNYNSAQLSGMSSGADYQFGPLAGFDVDTFKEELLKAICTEDAPTTAQVNHVIALPALDYGSTGFGGGGPDPLDLGPTPKK